MELVNASDKDPMDPTPKLKSSSIPILFISFNEKDNNCLRCGEKYIWTPFCSQKYCKRCLSLYITDNNNNMNLDVYLLGCNKHKIIGTINIEECCRNYLKILFFKQIPVKYCCHNASDSSYYNSYNVIKREKYCNLCEKSLCLGTNHNIAEEFKLCSDCYLISSGYIESTLTKKPIPIIYLPWWNNISYCETCYSKLTFTSECQKYCMNCLIFYIGCRYCLTTNIIFGFINQSQCKKCERISFITFDKTNISSGNSCLDDFLFSSRYSNLKLPEFAEKIKNIDKYFLPISICDSIYQNYRYSCTKTENLLEWIPYSQFTNVIEIARGGFGIIYQATWLNDSLYDNDSMRKKNRGNKRNEIVILKRFKNSKNIGKYFLNEVNIFTFKLFYLIFYK
jgi:hypothetical protein